LLWHVHQEQFENIGETGKYLNVLNVAANMVGIHIRLRLTARPIYNCRSPALIKVIW
jgi:hypothetical protein